MRKFLAVLVLGVGLALSSVACDDTTGSLTGPDVVYPPSDLPEACQPAGIRMVAEGGASVQRSQWPLHVNPDLVIYPLTERGNPLGNTCDYNVWQYTWELYGPVPCDLYDGTHSRRRQIECYEQGKVSVHGCIVTGRDPGDWICDTFTFQITAG